MTLGCKLPLMHQANVCRGILHWYCQYNQHHSDYKKKRINGVFNLKKQWLFIPRVHNSRESIQRAYSSLLHHGVLFTSVYSCSIQEYTISRISIDKN